MIKAGDLVKVTDWGKSYSTNTDWFADHLCELKPLWVVKYAYGDVSNYNNRRTTDSSIYRVLYSDGNMILITRNIISNEIYAVYLISTDGVKKCEESRDDTLTDKEQRIFLAAMAREKQICQEMDNEYTHEPYETTLVEVCDEIKRKVKETLWQKQETNS